MNKLGSLENSDWIRDPKSGMVVVKKIDGYNQAILQRRQLIDINNMKKEINNINQDISDIKNMLGNIVEMLKGNNK